MSDALPAPYPPGDYAIVEIMGHTTLVGRITEVERFGTKMLAIEPIFKGEFLPVVMQGGASIYRITLCTAETAFAAAPTRYYQLPQSIRLTIPPALLPTSNTGTETRDGEAEIDPDDEEF